MCQQLEELEQWYLRQCNDEWEHRYGIEIQTLDNPGWSVRIELTGTDCEDMPFLPVRDGTIIDNCTPDVWIDCRVEDRVFAGDSNSLCRILDTFLAWASSSCEP